MSARWRIPLVVAGALLAGAPVAAAPLIEQATSPGGVRYWRAFLPKAHTSAIVAVWRDGWGSATPGKEALSIVAPGWMARGDRAHSASEVSELLKDYLASAAISGSATLARATVSLEAPPEKIAAAAELLAAALAGPRLSEVDLRRIQRDFAAANRNSESSGDGLAMRVASRYMFGDGPLSRLLEPSAAQAIGRDDAEAWRGAVLARDSLVLAVAGPMTKEDLGPVIDRIFSGLPGKSAAPATFDPPARIAARTIVVEKAEAQTLLLALADSDVRHETESVEAEIGRRILGAGADARLGDVLRKTLGATYGVSASFQSVGPRRQILAMRTALAHDKARPALAALKREYERWRTEGVTQVELDATRSNLLSYLGALFASPRSTASRMADLAFAGRSPEDIADFERRIAALKPADVNAVLRRRFGAALLIVIVAPSAEGYDADCVVKASLEALKCR